MNGKKIFAFFTKLLFLSLLGLGVYFGSFILPEDQHAVILRFGAPLGQGISQAGLHFKIPFPFVDKVHFLDKRVLSWNGRPIKILTADKKYISATTSSRWKIFSPVSFLQAFPQEKDAGAKIHNILESITRDIIGSHPLVETIRNSNEILEEELRGEGEEDIGDLERIQIGREKLCAQITQKANEKLNPFGIQILDVQLSRIAYDSSVEDRVYARMISQRERMAHKIASQARGEVSKIEGEMELELKKIQADTYREVQQIQGSAQAQAHQIYAKAFSVDPGFFEFQKTLESYKNAIHKKTKLILSTQGEFFKLLGEKSNLK